MGHRKPEYAGLPRLIQVILGSVVIIAGLFTFMLVLRYHRSLEYQGGRQAVVFWYGIASVIMLIGSGVILLPVYRTLRIACGSLMIIGGLIGIIVVLLNHRSLELDAGWEVPARWYGINIVIMLVGSWLIMTAPDRTPIRPKRCPECDYDLRGGRDRGCPECGWGRAS